MVMADRDPTSLQQQQIPSAQNVGREFVRQYYTLLHDNPTKLHRFYSHNSSFIHGGVEHDGKEEEPVIGQLDIHKKILSLGFHDCHAKICQVDSHATLANGVVVQVTGELSNNGLPLRRFMQTFVLAPQSPKKYYVHNDIFRYQDEVFAEDVPEESEGSEAISMTEDIGHATTVSIDVATSDKCVGLENTPTTFPGFQEAAAQTVSNGTAHMDDPVPPAPVEKAKEFTPITPSETSDSPGYEEGSTKTNDSKSTTDEASSTPRGSPSIVPEDSTPKTYATIVNRIAGNPEMAKNAGLMSVPSKERVSTIADTSPQKKPMQKSRKPATPPSTVAAAADDGDKLRRSGQDAQSRYPDTYQIFIGNLPLGADQKDLKDFFMQYGNVVELRVQKSHQGPTYPNFGFVVFDSAESAADVLKKAPVYWNDHRLNVEVKKPKDQTRNQVPRPNSGCGGRGGRGGDRPVFSPDHGGMRGGGRGGRGGRAGQRPASNFKRR